MKRRLLREKESLRKTNQKNDYFHRVKGLCRHRRKAKNLC